MTIEQRRNGIIGNVFQSWPPRIPPDVFEGTHDSNAGDMERKEVAGNSFSRAQVDFGVFRLYPIAMAENIFSRLSAAHLKRAAAIKERIEELEKELTGMLGIPEAATIGGTIRRHRKMSAAARAKISAAAKARWAQVRAGKK